MAQPIGRLALLAEALRHVTVQASSRSVKAKLLALYEDLLAHNGYGELRVEVRILKRGQKEVILHCGKQYRYVVDYRPADSLSREGDETGGDGSDSEGHTFGLDAQSTANSLRRSEAKTKQRDGAGPFDDYAPPKAGGLRGEDAS